MEWGTIKAIRQPRSRTDKDLNPFNIEDGTLENRYGVFVPSFSRPGKEYMYSVKI
jgi:hypothetical protein